MASRHFPKGLDGRQRDGNPPKAGQIRERRADTPVRTLREEYGPDFAKGYPSNATLAGFGTIPARACISWSGTRRNKPLEPTTAR